MKIWTITYNDDNGLTTEVVTSREIADHRATEWVQTQWDEQGPAGPCPTPWKTAFDKLCDQLGFMDSIGIQEHNFYQPFHDEGSLEALIIDFVPDRSDGDLEVDDNAIVAYGEYPGAYVQCWKWVPWSHIDEPMVIIEKNGMVWYFEEFDEFYGAWENANQTNDTWTRGSPELLERSEGANDAEQFIIAREGTP